MYYFFPNEGGRVFEVQTGAIPEGAIFSDVLPDVPEIPKGMQPALFYINGSLEWRIEVMPEPQPEPAPTKAEQEAHRAEAYRERVDPITCEIQRLRDMGGTEAEIAEAEQRRAEAVQAVKDEYPYPVEGEK